MVWRAIVEGVLNLGFRSECPLCQRRTTSVFCPDCSRQLQACQTQTSSPEVFAWGSYGGALKRAIALLKYNGRAEIARPLGQWLAQAWLQQASGRQFVLVPIPLHEDRHRQRGYNQAELIAHSFGQIVGVKVSAQALIRHQATQAQFGLSIAERHHNLEQAFVLGPDFQRQRPQWPVLLLDDIYTTGATIQAATQILQTAGIKVHGAVAVAQAHRFSPQKYRLNAAPTKSELRSPPKQ
ncbi:MAG: ComF family protein [Thermosynechococcaceae cyanobacterium]